MPVESYHENADRKQNPDQDLSQQILGLMLKRFRFIVGISQNTVALIAGTDPSYLSDIERGQSKISMSKLQEICLALDIEESHLLELCRLIQQSAEFEHPERLQ